MARELEISVSVVGAEQATSALDAVATAEERVTAAADKASPALDKAADAVKEQGKAAKESAISNAELTQVIQRYAGPAIVVAAARATLDFADKIQALSDNTKVSAVVLQQWGHVAGKNESSIIAVANAVQRLSSNVAAGSKPVRDMLSELGLSAERIFALDPERRFREVAIAIASIENPAMQARAAQVLLGRSGVELISTMEDIAKGADKYAPAMANSWVKANADVQSSIDELLAHAKTLGMWFIGWAPAIVNWAAQIGDAWQKNVLQRIYGVQGGVPPPALNGQAPTPYPSPTPAGALPLPTTLSGAPLTTIPFTPAAGGSRRVGGGGASVLPFVPPGVNGATQAAIWAMGNTPGGFSAGRLPFMSSLAPLPSGGSPIGFDNGIMLPGTVGMNAPGGGGSWLSNLFKGKGGQIAGLGMGLLSNLIPGLSRTGSSIGSTVGSLFGPLGSGIGSLAGGLFGKLFGGNSDKKEINKIIGGNSFKDLQAEATRLGISMDKVFSAKKVKDFEKAVQDVTKQIQDQEDESVQVQAAMERWGLSIEDMGKKFQQTQMDQAAKGLIEDFTTLVDAGASVEKVIEKMGGAINEFISKAVAMGLEVPRSMKPIVDRMYEQGLLVDENGDKLTEQAYASIQWATTMTQGFDKVEAAINRLTNAILGIEDGFNDAAAAADNFGDAAAAATGGEGGGGPETSASFSTGGVAGRDYRRPGHGDLIPAMLRRGERVLPPGVSGGGVSVSGITINVGHGSSRADFVEAVGEAIVSYGERRGLRLVS